MKTKWNIGWLAILLLFAPGVAMAQYRSGSVQLDAYLRNLSVAASLDFGSFRTRVISMYNISSGRMERLYAEMGRSPADLFMLLEVGRLTRRSPENLFPIYLRYRRQGWGMIAKQAGIKPGSPAFHAMKAQAERQSYYLAQRAAERRYYTQNRLPLPGNRFLDRNDRNLDWNDRYQDRNDRYLDRNTRYLDRNDRNQDRNDRKAKADKAKKPGKQ